MMISSTAWLFWYVSGYGEHCEALSATQTNLAVLVGEEKAHRTVGSVIMLAKASYNWISTSLDGRYGGRAHKGMKKSFAGGMLSV
jgi:hypothetical protein